MLDMTPQPMALSQMYNQWLFENHPAIKLLSAIVEYQIWLYLQYKFMMPAHLISKSGDMEDWMKQFSLNGLRSNLCKPY